jgi:hypothetical protein
MRVEAPRRAAPLDVAKAVLSGLLGVRRRADHESVRITPLQLIAAGLVLAALFIFTLITIVRIVLS